jgi:hypothetical protein
MEVGDRVQERGKSAKMIIQEIVGERANCIEYNLASGAGSNWKWYNLADLELVRDDPSEKKTKL